MSDDAVRRALRSQISLSSAPVEEPPAKTPPPPLVEEPREEPTEELPRDACGVCHEGVTARDDRLVRGECKHAFHLVCIEPLLASGKRYCVRCSLARSSEEAVSRGGYTIDAGDADVRELVASALAYRREQVRSALVQRASGALRTFV